MAFSWSKSPSQAFNPMFDRRVAAIHQKTYQLAQRRSIDIANWMKDEAPWVDRTGNARQGLACDVIVQGTMITLLLTIGRHPGGGFLSYGKYLELSMGGRFSIVGPAVDHWAPIVYQDTRALLR